MKSAMKYETIRVEPCTVNIGAQIYDIDLRAPLATQQIEEVKAALTEHQVIFFRDQQLDHDSHQRFGQYFGELTRHSAGYGLSDHPFVVEIRGDANSTYVAGDSWHSDLSCDETPPMGSILNIHTLPEVGGDTLFASMYAAYDALSDKMKAYIGGLRALHDAEPVYRPIINDAQRRFPSAVHPVVRTHPVSGRKALFINAQYTTRIVDVSRDESDAILGYLNKHCTNPDFQVRFRWQPNSVAFWDNRCVQHYAVWDYFPQVRSGYRVTIKGERPE